MAVSGKTVRVENTFTFTNHRHQRHVYKIHGPLNLEWFHILGADQFEIDPGQSRSITFAFKLDAVNVPVAVYEGEIIARCLDCSQEQTCDLTGLLLPIRVKVIAGPGISGDAGTGTATQGGKTQVSARRLQEVTLAKDGTLSQRIASDEQVGQVVNWTNRVIVAGQPSYPAQSVVPHFRSSRDRDESFQAARLKAILRNDAPSYQILGDLYVDWGKGAKALDSYNRASSGQGDTAESLTSLGEAYRLMGSLDKAEVILSRAAGMNRSGAPTLNALGNVYLDQARVARDKRRYDLARNHLKKARSSYTEAFQAQPEPPTKGPKKNRSQDKPRTRGDVTASNVSKAVSQSNLGEVYLLLGEIVREQGRGEEALDQYQVAEQAFRNAAQIDQTYPFAITGLGGVYRQVRKVAQSQGDETRAREAAARAQEQYVRAIRLHNDLAQAYVGLGNLLEDVGRKEQAIRNYLQATLVRPEEPAPHYYLALGLADSNRRQAAEQARTYLKLEPTVFKQGEKAHSAGRVAQFQPPAISTSTPTPIVPPTMKSTEITPSAPTTAERVKIPGVKGDKPEAALKKLRERKLEGQIREQADCDATGKVLSTSPKKDEKVPPGTVVTLVVSSAGEHPSTVPRLTGLHQNDALQELRRVGLRPKTRRQETDRAAPDTVLRQKPEPDKNLPQGCTVELTIAARIPRVGVPNYVGLTREEAFRQLPKYLGELIRGNVSEVDSDQPAGTVIDQNPKAGEWVQRGTAVDLVIARSSSVEEPKVEVPNVVGMKASDAKATLVPNLIPYARCRDYQIVSSQSPPAFQLVPRGSLVTLMCAPD